MPGSRSLGEEHGSARLWTNRNHLTHKQTKEAGSRRDLCRGIMGKEDNNGVPWGGWLYPDTQRGGSQRREGKEKAGTGRKGTDLVCKYTYPRGHSGHYLCLGGWRAPLVLCHVFLHLCLLMCRIT